MTKNEADEIAYRLGLGGNQAALLSLMMRRESVADFPSRNVQILRLRKILGAATIINEAQRNTPADYRVNMAVIQERLLTAPTRPPRAWRLNGWHERVLMALIEAGEGGVMVSDLTAIMQSKSNMPRVIVSQLRDLLPAGITIETARASMERRPRGAPGRGEGRYRLSATSWDRLPQNLRAFRGSGPAR